MDEELVIARIIVTRSIAEDGRMLDEVVAEDGDGDPLDTAQALGLLRVAEHRIVCSCDD